jgi:hypothetical protein
VVEHKPIAWLEPACRDAFVGLASFAVVVCWAERGCLVVAVAYLESAMDSQ